MAKKLVPEVAAEERLGGWLEAWKKGIPRSVLSKHCWNKKRSAQLLVCCLPMFNF